MMDAPTAQEMAEIFRVLADPARLRIVDHLIQHEEVCVHRLAIALGMTQPAVSHHLRLLRQMRLVAYRREGRHVFYRLDDRHVQDLFIQAYSHAAHRSAIRVAEASGA